MQPASPLETWFAAFRRNIIGQDQCFDTPFGHQKIVYADWTASGRAYLPIEQRLLEEVLPFFGNTHTETTITGRRMSAAYEEAKSVIKNHVHAGTDDVLLFCGSGMTAAVNKLQRMLGLRLPERISDFGQFLSREEALRPLVLVTHMEHHSNYISWLETIATVETIRPDGKGNVDLHHLRQLLGQHRHRKTKIAAVTACSNVTGIETPYHAIASLMHEYDGVCFVDFASSAPYVHIDMHPVAAEARLDAIYFSCHKFLGGPGTPGVLIFSKGLCNNRVPDHPGGGTILYSNPWKDHEYIADIQQREDGGTPPILQGIKAALCIRLKEEMGVDNIRRRETEMLKILFDRLSAISGIHILAANNRDRLAIISFLVEGAHHDRVVQLLNDRFGIQARGGCSCAGPYGHLLLNIDKPRSYKIWRRLRAGDIYSKPGWVRLSFHPTMTDAEIDYIMDAVERTVTHYKEWSSDQA